MNGKIKIFMEDAMIVKDQAFFFSRYWNGLYVAELETGKVELISTMPEEDIMTSRLCASIVYHDGKLILVPMVAKKIWIYDLEMDSWKGLERKYVTDTDVHKEMFRAIEYNNFLFLIGSNYPAIIQMNLDNYELKYWKEPYDFLEPVKEKGECYFRSDHLILGNQLFLASCLNCFVLCLNLDTFDFNWIKVGERGFRYSGIAWDGNCFWLSPREDSPIVKWDGKDKMDYFSLPDGFEHNRYYFSGVQCDGRRLVFPGMTQNRTIVMDSEYPHNMEIQKEQYTFYRCLSTGEMFSQTADGKFRWRNSGHNKLVQMYCEISLEELKKYFQAQIEDKDYRRLKEGIIAEFPSAVLLYLLMVEQKVKTGKLKSKVGEIVWRTIRS